MLYRINKIPKIKKVSWSEIVSPWLIRELLRQKKVVGLFLLRSWEEIYQSMPQWPIFLGTCLARMKHSLTFLPSQTIHTSIFWPCLRWIKLLAHLVISSTIWMTLFWPWTAIIDLFEFNNEWSLRVNTQIRQFHLQQQFWSFYQQRRAFGQLSKKRRIVITDWMQLEDFSLPLKSKTGLLAT